MIGRLTSRMNVSFGWLELGMASGAATKQPPKLAGTALAVFRSMQSRDSAQFDDRQAVFSARACPLSNEACSLPDSTAISLSVAKYRMGEWKRGTVPLFSIRCRWRPEPESNRRARICSPLRNHSAIGPMSEAPLWRRSLRGQGASAAQLHPKATASRVRSYFDQWRLAHRPFADKSKT